MKISNQIAQNVAVGYHNSHDRLESFAIYKLACHLFEQCWGDCDLLEKDYRGRELAKQQVRSLDSICANIEAGFGRRFGREWPQHLKIARGEARESLGRYTWCRHLLPADLIAERHAALDHIIGGLTKTIRTIEAKQAFNATNAARHPSPAIHNGARHSPPATPHTQ